MNRSHGTSQCQSARDRFPAKDIGAHQYYGQSVHVMVAELQFFVNYKAGHTWRFLARAGRDLAQDRLE